MRIFLKSLLESHTQPREPTTASAAYSTPFLRSSKHIFRSEGDNKRSNRNDFGRMPADEPPWRASTYGRAAERASSPRRDSPSKYRENRRRVRMIFGRTFSESRRGFNGKNLREKISIFQMIHCIRIFQNF